MISLCDLCVLFVSVVGEFINHRGTENTGDCTEKSDLFLGA